MEIIEYFCAENQEHWLSKIGESDWGAGRYLYELLRDGKLKQLVGEHTRVLLLAEGDQLVSFCTFAEKDDIPSTVLTPWIGWVYTFPDHRGRRCAGILLGHAEALAKKAGMRHIYISTDHNGLYEKYGYEFYQVMKDVHGEDARVYVKHL